MIKLREKWAAEIDVNNVCHHNCTYCTKHIRKFKSLIDETFGEVYTNFHEGEQKKLCLHHPLLLPVKDMAPNEQVMWELIENCWCNRMWSPIIGKKGAFFCDCALGFDVALDMGGGWPVEPGWWKREDYRDLMEKYCPSAACVCPIQDRS